MGRPINVLLAIDAGVRPDVLELVLPPQSGIEIVGVVQSVDDSWAVEGTPIDLFVVACAGYSDRALLLISTAEKQLPGLPVVVLCDGSPNGFVRRVFEAGADDIVTLPEAPETLRFALEKAVARKEGSRLTAGGVAAPLICVLGPKGGTGKTLTSANLAVALAEQGSRVAFVDLDLQFGDVGLALGLSPDRTIYDLATAPGSLDADKLEAYLTSHESGVRVLLAPNRPDQASSVTVDFLRELYATLRASNEFVIVDTPPGFTPEVISAIDASSAICMVGMLDSLSLKNTKLGLETLRLMGYDDDRVLLVLNRADTRVGITGDDVRAIVGRKPDILVPSDRDIARTVNEGQPIVLAKRSSDAARAFRGLAQVYLDMRASMIGDSRPKKRERLLAWRR